MVSKRPVFSTKPVVNMECGSNSDVLKFRYKTPACVMSIAFLLPINRFLSQYAEIVDSTTNLLGNVDLRRASRATKDVYGDINILSEVEYDDEKSVEGVNDSE